MTTETHDSADNDRTELKARLRYDFDRTAPDYKDNFDSITAELHQKCPIAWSETHGGHWVISGGPDVFGIARNGEALSSDHDIANQRRGYQGIAIPKAHQYQMGFLEMDPPGQRHYRQALNPYMSPAAVERWIPFADDICRAVLNERIETGSIDFVEELANVVPAIQTLAMLGLPLVDWPIYNEPFHAAVYTPPDSPDMPRVMELVGTMLNNVAAGVASVRANPRPGLIDAIINAEIEGRAPTDDEVIGTITLLIGGGFDTTTALTTHSLEWLSAHPDERDRLSKNRDALLDSATEEFLRFYTPAPGDGRTVSADFEYNGVQFKEGDRLWLSWAMANRDPEMFECPHEIEIDRKGNRHQAFGLGVHRCIGSNMGRMMFKRMLTAVLDRMPDFVVDSSGREAYESIAMMNGMRHLPATFTPGPRVGDGLDATIERLQKVCDEQRIAEPVTKSTRVAKVD